MANLLFEQRTFSKGEVSPSFLGRSDLQAYGQGLSVAHNAIVTETGSIRKRPGLTNVDALPGATSIFPFKFNNDNVYIVAILENNIIIYHNDEFLTFAEGVVNPWATGERSSISYTQSGDVLFLVHPDYPPHKLVRYEHDRWCLELDTFEFWDYGEQAYTWGVIGDGTTSGTTDPSTVTDATVRFSVSPTSYNEDAGSSLAISSIVSATISAAPSSNLAIAVSIAVVPASTDASWATFPTISGNTLTISSGATTSDTLTVSGATNGRDINGSITISGESASLRANPPDAYIWLSVRQRGGPR